MRLVRILVCIVTGLFATSVPALPAVDAADIVYNIEKNDIQSVLVGPIDSLSIVRGNAQFHLGPGKLTLFDFGSGRIAAMVFEGTGRFRYAPPDDVERYQLRRFTKIDTLDGGFDKLTIFFTIQLESFPDTSGFIRAKVSEGAWSQLTDAAFEEFDHMWIDVTNDLLGDLLAEGPGSYFNAYFSFDEPGRLVFIGNPLYDDVYSLYNLTTYSGASVADQIGGYSPNHDLPSQRGIVPVDITHYSIKARIEGNGDMKVETWVHFVPLRSGRRYFQLFWNSRNKLISAFDSDGLPLLAVRKQKGPGLFHWKKDDGNFGLVFNNQLQLAESDSVLIIFESDALEEIYSLYFIKDGIYWYPHNSIRDVATFDMTFDCPKQYQVVACGDCIETSVKENRHNSRWESKSPTDYISFNIGSFKNRDFKSDGLSQVKVYVSDKFRHADMALSDLAYYGELSTADMLGAMGKDVINSLAFFTSIMGPCPFDTVRAVEMLHKVGYYSVMDTMGAALTLDNIDWDIEDRYSNLDKTVVILPRYLVGQGSPGLLNLSYELFQSNRVGGYYDKFKANIIAFQWWGHLVDTEIDRDYWILYGLAHYCGLWYYEMSSKNQKSVDDLLELSRQKIMWGYGSESVGHKAGPVVMGWRLLSSKSDDYDNVVYHKGAYIFHMIRYLFHDYKTGSDDAFAAFLRDLAARYAGKVITTEGLKALLEKHIGDDMTWFFDQWVYGTEIPKYYVKIEWDESIGNKYQVKCHVVQKDVPPDFKMIVPITVLFDDDKYIHFKSWVDKPEMEIILPLMPYKPRKVIFNTYDAVLGEVSYR